MKECIYLLRNYYPDYSIENTPVLVQYGNMLTSHSKVSEQKCLHKHDYYEFVLIEEGNAVHKVNGKLFVVEKGTLALIRPDDIHTFLPHLAARYKMYNVDISVEEFEKISAFLGGQPDILLSSKYPRTIILSESKLRDFASLLNRLNKMKPDALRGAYAKAIISSVLMELITMDSQVAPLPQWLSNLAAELSRPEVLCANPEHLFGETGFSREYICRCFKKFFGITPTQYINEQKILLAANLLINTDTELIEICTLSGFENLGYFHKNFRKYFDMPPGQYRKQFRKTEAPS